MKEALHMASTQVPSAFSESDTASQNKQAMYCLRDAHTPFGKDEETHTKERTVSLLLKGLLSLGPKAMQLIKGGHREQWD